MNNEYSEDCIHLKACRRLSKIAKSQGKTFTRGCNDNCSAYVSGKNSGWLTQEEATYIARLQYNGNSDPFDVYCSWDFPSHTLDEIIETTENEVTYD